MDWMQRKRGKGIAGLLQQMSIPGLCRVGKALLPPKDRRCLLPPKDGLHRLMCVMYLSHWKRLNLSHHTFSVPTISMERTANG